MEKIRYISGERCLPDGEILVQVAERVSEIVEWINERDKERVEEYELMRKWIDKIDEWINEHDKAGGEHDPK